MSTVARKPLAYYLELEYPFNVVADPEGGYVAVYPDLPGCMTQGDTLEELVAMAEDAKQNWIEVEYERGNDIPVPSYPEEYSGKFNVRIPKALHRALVDAAQREEVSLNQYVLSLLARRDSQERIEWRLEALVAKVDTVAKRLPTHISGMPTSRGLRDELRAGESPYALVA